MYIYIYIYIYQCQIVLLFSELLHSSSILRYEAKITIDPHNNYYVLTLFVLSNFHITLPESSQIHPSQLHTENIRVLSKKGKNRPEKLRKWTLFEHCFLPPQDSSGNFNECSS